MARGRTFASYLLLLITMTLAACGGSGGEDDNGGDPTPTLSIAAASLGEGDAGQAQMMFQVTLSPAAQSTVTASYSTDDAPADNSDYVAANGQVTLNAGTTSATIAVDVLGDTVIEADEQFTVGLSNASNAIVIWEYTAEREIGATHYMAP